MAVHYTSAAPRQLHEYDDDNLTLFRTDSDQIGLLFKQNYKEFYIIFSNTFSKTPESNKKKGKEARIWENGGSGRNNKALDFSGENGNENGTDADVADVASPESVSQIKHI